MRIGLISRDLFGGCARHRRAPGRRRGVKRPVGRGHSPVVSGWSVVPCAVQRSYRARSNTSDSVITIRTSNACTRSRTVAGSSYGETTTPAFCRAAIEREVGYDATCADRSFMTLAR